MLLNELPYVPLHQIFDYLDSRTLICSIGITCKYLREAIRSYNRLRLESIPISDLTKITKSIPAENIISLTILGNCQETSAEFSRFINLQSLNNTIRLKKLSIKTCCQNLQRTSHLLKSLSQIIGQTNVTILLLDISTTQQVILYNLIQPFQHILQQLTIDNCHYNEYKQILTNFPHLQTLIMKSCSFTGIDRVTKFSSISQLTCLSLFSRSLSVDELHFVLQLTPFLTKLELKYEGNEFARISDGNRWENFVRIHLQSLQTFDFEFVYGSQRSIDLPSFHSILTSFQTQFWLEEMHRHVQCEYSLTLNKTRVYTSKFEEIIDFEIIIKDSLTLPVEQYSIFTRSRSSSNHYLEKEITDKLEISNISIFNTGAYYLNHILSTNPRITSLVLRKNELSSYAINLIINGFQHIQTMFSLEDNVIDKNGIRCLTKVLQNNDNLTTIKFKQNQIGLKSLECIAYMIKTNHTLKTLHIDKNAINDNGIKFIADAFKQNETLQVLSLQDNKITNIGAEYLGEALKINQSLIELNLENNQLGFQGVQFLANALQQNTTLCSLNIAYNQIGYWGIKYLTDALKTNTKLTTLNLRGNHIGLDGIKYLCETLRHNQTLKILNMAFNDIENEGIQCIAKVLQYNTTITTIIISKDDSKLINMCECNS